MKDHPPDERYVLLGDGTIAWKKTLQAAVSAGGVECHVVERERCPAPLTPMQHVKRCLQNG